MSNREDTWCSLEEALTALDYSKQKFDGIGLIIPDHLVGIDLDDCIDPVTGKYSTESQMVLSMTDTYAEVSPSGEGIKLLCSGTLSDKLKKIDHSKGIELYEGGKTNKYFTITGHSIRAAEIGSGRNALSFLQSAISGPKEELQGEVSAADSPTAIECLGYLGEDFADNYDSWNQVGMALKSVENSEEMLQRWIDWSEQSAKFDGPNSCRDKWESYVRTDGRMVTINYLKHQARENGWNPDKFRTGSISGAELLKKKIVREYLVEDLLIKGEPGIIGGASKSLKTTVAEDLVVSLVTGTPFLGEFKVPKKVPVLFISGESGEGTTQETLQAIADRKGIKASDLARLHIGFKLPKLDDLSQVEDLIAEMRSLGIETVVVDPLYRALRVGDAASNVYAMGEKLELIAEKIHRAGITILLAHHFRKQGQSFHEAPELEDLSQSGVAEFGRQFILLKRKEKYQYDGQHKLWFTWGGSAGHQGAKVLVAETGTRKTGIVWKPSVLSYQEFADSESAAKDLVKGEKRRIFAEHLKKLLTNLPGLNSTEIKKSIQGKAVQQKEWLEELEKIGFLSVEKGPRGSRLHYLNEEDPFLEDEL